MQHCTKDQRVMLEALLKAGHTQSYIASVLHCHQSTISREIKRNKTNNRHYNASIAQKRSGQRRKSSYKALLRWHHNPVLLEHIITELRDGKSPEQISGRLKYKKQGTISHVSIYTYIKHDKKNGGTLFKYLRYQGTKHKWRGFNTSVNRIPNRRDITERPATVEAKQRTGDWESDLVVSNRKGSGALATFAERKHLYLKAIKVESQSADEMVRATKEALKDFPASLRRTMTHDNGKEICKHEEITKQLQIDVYCARPYRSCDRGLNEWYNRELRRFFPKGTDFSKITQKEVDIAVDWLNNCPRKSLSYRTPRECLEEELAIMRFTL